MIWKIKPMSMETTIKHVYIETTYYWVCPNCGQRHPVTDPAQLDRLARRETLEFECKGEMEGEGCGEVVTGSFKV